MQGLKIGRNDPCPCGSGKKYKKCCLYKASSPVASLGRRKLRRVENELVPALMKHAEKYYGPGVVHEAWDEFTLRGMKNMRAGRTLCWDISASMALS